MTRFTEKYQTYRY